MSDYSSFSSFNPSNDARSVDYSVEELVEHYNDYHSELLKHFPHLHIPPLTNYLLSLYTRIRNRQTNQPEFINGTKSIIHSIMEFTLGLKIMNQTFKTNSDKNSNNSDTTVPTLYSNVSVETPLGANFFGCDLNSSNNNFNAVSIMRGGLSMELVLREMIPSISFGHLLIQRREIDRVAEFQYAKLSSHLIHSTTPVLLLDPCSSTGSSLILGIEQLIKHGVQCNRIVIVTLIACPTAINSVFSQFPSLFGYVCGMIDPTITKGKYLTPGIGDMGDRFFGTFYD